jgi:hypothetical protein
MLKIIQLLYWSLLALLFGFGTEVISLFCLLCQDLDIHKSETKDVAVGCICLNFRLDAI